MFATVTPADAGVATGSDRSCGFLTRHVASCGPVVRGRRARRAAVPGSRNQQQTQPAASSRPQAPVLVRLVGQPRGARWRITPDLPVCAVAVILPRVYTDLGVGAPQGAHRRPPPRRRRRGLAEVEADYRGKFEKNPTEKTQKTTGVLVKYRNSRIQPQTCRSPRSTWTALTTSRSTTTTTRARTRYMTPWRPATSGCFLRCSASRPTRRPPSPLRLRRAGARVWRSGTDLNEKDDIDGCTPLQLAFMHGHVECAKLLIGVGAGVSPQAVWCLASHMAVGLGAFRGLRDRCMPLLSLILEKDDLTLKDDGGFVSVHIAAGFGLTDCVEAILDKTENRLVEARDRLGARPMHHAARGSHVDVMALLLRRGASVDAANALGTTVLHTAVAHAQWDAVSFLMEHSANASAVDKRGLTAGSYASRRGLAPPPELRAKLAMGDAGGAEASQPACTAAAHAPPDE